MGANALVRMRIRIQSHILSNAFASLSMFCKISRILCVRIRIPDRILSPDCGVPKKAQKGPLKQKTYNKWLISESHFFNFSLLFYSKKTQHNLFFGSLTYIHHQKWPFLAFFSFTTSLKMVISQPFYGSMAWNFFKNFQTSHISKTKKNWGTLTFKYCF